MRYNGIEIAEKKATALVNPAVKPMTADEYFARPETMLPEQLLDGELIMSPAPTFAHQVASRNLLNLVQALIPNGDVFYSPVDIWLDERNVVQPDLFWLAGSSRCQLIKGRLFGPPELVVEILSPGTERYDRSRKFNLYETHGVPEYWIVDLDVRAVEVWSLQNGVYERLGNFLSGSSFESPALGGQRVETAPIFPPAE